MHMSPIGGHQLMPAALVQEIAMHALLLHEPGDEVEVALPVLDAEGPAGMVIAELEVSQHVIGKDLCNDVLRRLVLEDAAVPGSGQQPSPGSHDAQIPMQTPLAAGLLEGGGDAVELAPASLGCAQTQGNWPGQQLIGPDVASPRKC